MAPKEKAALTFENQTADSSLKRNFYKINRRQAALAAALLER